MHQISHFVKSGLGGHGVVFCGQSTPCLEPAPVGVLDERHGGKVRVREQELVELLVDLVRGREVQSFERELVDHLLLELDLLQCPAYAVTIRVQVGYWLS